MSRNRDFEQLDLLVPETKEIFKRRFELLRLIEVYGPIGRRNLSIKSNQSERQVRNDGDFFKDRNFITYQMEGMAIAPEGIRILEELEEISEYYNGYMAWKKIIIENLGIKDMVIVDAHRENFRDTQKYMGIQGAKLLKKMLRTGDVIGLTGGTSVYHLVESFKVPQDFEPEVSLVPARGGLGRTTKYQANTLTEHLAHKMKGRYVPLYTPDSLGDEALKYLREDPGIKQAIDTIEEISLLVFGIGKADVMAKRRNLSNLVYNEIMAAGAVAEAFGYFFNGKGDIVHEIPTIGITLEKVKRLDKLIAIAGGAEKARAIIAVARINKNLVLVTDQLCVQEIIKIIGRKT